MRLLGIVLLSAALDARSSHHPVAKPAPEKPAEFHYVLVPDETDAVIVKVPSPLRDTQHSALQMARWAMHFMLPPNQEARMLLPGDVYDIVAPDGTMHTIDLSLVTDLKLRPEQTPFAYDVHGERDAV